MNDDLRQRMLGWAARARSNPKFDLEERDHRLEVARLVAEILEAVAQRDPLADHVERLYAFMRPRLPEVVLPRQLIHLQRWAAEDEAGLAEALSGFTEASAPPEDRLARFVEAFQAREASEQAATYGFVLASLFNFGTAPDEIPIVRSPVFAALERTLGGQPPEGSPSEQYVHYLEFARSMHDMFGEAGIPVRGMIDTEALILTCWEDHLFWSSDDDGRRPRKKPPEHYLTACAIYRDEADYLAEWLEFHHLVGFERFYLYDNLSSDHHLDVLEPYIEDDLVVLHEWPHVPGQFKAYDHCLATYGEQSRWIGFFDIDEFLFSPTYKPVAEMLTGYEQWPAVCVNVPRFGTSGHQAKPEGLVIENYLLRLQVLAERTVKSVVDPAAVESCRNAHTFQFHGRGAVDPNGFPVHSTATKSASLELLRANHYYSKSEQELRAKHTRRTADYGWERRALPDSATLAQREAEHGVRDDTILHYAGPLREALSRRGSR